MYAFVPGDASNLDPVWSIVTNAPIPVCFKDPKGFLLFANTAYVNATGKPREQVLGRKESDLFPQQEASELRAEDLAVMSAREARESVTTLTLTGKVRTVKAMKFPIFDTQGEILGVCGIAVDITDALVVKETLRRDRAREIEGKPFERLLATLTNQEARIAELLLLGHSDKQIAETLNLTTDTVRHHVSHLLKKLHKRSRTQAVIAMLKVRKRD